MPTYKFVHAYPGHFKAGDTATDADLERAGLSANVLSKDGYVSVDGEMVTPTTSYAPAKNPAATSPAAVASPAKPANESDTDH